MAIAALTPRVRTIVICDDVTPSLIEDGVFTLEGVRSHFVAETLPYRASLCLFLLLSSPRKGRYPGKILFVNARTERPIRYVKFVATFPEDNKLLPVTIEVGHCVFPESGTYTFEVYFSAQDGGEALKGEQPFALLTYED
jgi:hypothetical protein